MVLLRSPYGGATIDVAEDLVSRFTAAGWVDASGAPSFPEGAPEGDWKVAELRAYASEHEISLGGATSKADILDVLTKGEP